MKVISHIQAVIQKIVTAKEGKLIGLITTILIIILYLLLKIFVSNSINFLFFTLLFGFPVICLFLMVTPAPKNFIKTKIGILNEILTGCQIGYSAILFLALYSWTANPEVAILEPIFVSCATALAASMYCLRRVKQIYEFILLKND